MSRLASLETNPILDLTALSKIVDRDQLYPIHCAESIFPSPNGNTPEKPSLYGSTNGYSYPRDNFHTHHGKQVTRNRSRVLVCHDMRGNYLEDKYANGSSYRNAFQLYHWNVIDFFCYFSHNLVSIPPESWLNVCRFHNVKVLGTFITEWEQGSLTCQTLFASKESAIDLAKRLANIANKMCFDGWLINIENSLDPDIEVPNMLIFLEALTELMHRAVEGSVVIW